MCPQKKIIKIIVWMEAVGSSWAKWKLIHQKPQLQKQWALNFHFLFAKFSSIVNICSRFFWDYFHTQNKMKKQKKKVLLKFYRFTLPRLKSPTLGRKFLFLGWEEKANFGKFNKSRILWHCKAEKFYFVWRQVGMCLKNVWIFIFYNVFWTTRKQFLI